VSTSGQRAGPRDVVREGLDLLVCLAGLLVMMRAHAVLTGAPSRAKMSRRMQPSWAVAGKPIQVASVAQVNHRLIQREHVLRRGARVGWPARVDTW